MVVAFARDTVDLMLSSVAVRRGNPCLCFLQYRRQWKGTGRFYV